MMKRSGMLRIPPFLILFFLTGCWDLKEPNQLAFITGAALDLADNGQVQVSSQIAIPAVIGGGQNTGGGNENKKSFRVVSATGKNIMDAGQHLQTELSRTLFYGHRQTILIGQQMAEHGIDGVIDMFLRNPQSELRSTIYVVKGGQAKDILTTEPIFDPYSSTALVSEQGTLSLKPYYYRHLLADSLSQGTQPLLPAVELTSSKDYAYAGAAVLNKDDDLKLVGFLNTEESMYANWITGRLSNFTVTGDIPQGNGNVSLRMQSLNRRIRLSTVEGRAHLDVRLVGKGLVVENNSDLDPSVREDLRIIQEKLTQTAQASVRRLIDKAQKQLKTDLFGFGESVHEQHPLKWKAMRREWSETFQFLPISVKVELQCKDPGLTSSSVKDKP